jgi:hypothetical protein
VCLQLYILFVLYYCIVVTVWMYCIEANDCQSRWKVRKSWGRGAISNTRFFEGTDVSFNSAKIWVGWETIILQPSQFLPALLINRPCLYSQELLQFSGSQDQNLHWKLGQQTPSFGSLLAYLVGCATNDLRLFYQSS